MFHTLPPVLLLVLSLVAMAGCSNSKKQEFDISAIEKSDSIPKQIKQLVKAIAEHDTAKLAGIVSYPLSRPYPLHDLNSPQELEAYYSVLVDDSLQRAIATSEVADWEEYGWRGWSLNRGKYLWIDENLYDLPYLSAKESALLDSLAQREISSLHPSLQQGWTPENTLRALDNSAIFRIDRHTDEKGHPVYRLCKFDEVSGIGGLPSLILTGYKESEGTADTETFHFTSTDGMKATLPFDLPDGSTMNIEFQSPENEIKNVPVEKTYWLDIIKE